MRDGRVLLTCPVVVLTTLWLTAAPARADRRMIVLIDASGSMTATRNNSDGRGANRFEAAKVLATDRVLVRAATPGDPLRVAVYTFRGNSTLIPATRRYGISGFIDASRALDEIAELKVETDVGGSTPLAGAICDAANVLALTDATTQILQVSSDGEENSTPQGNPCQGSVHGEVVVAPAQYPEGTYQRRVLDHFAATRSVIVGVDLFESGGVTLAALNPLEQFFTFVTQSTGGLLTLARDSEPLPIAGDLNSDRCVDRADAILVARSFGPIAPPMDGRLDLNADRNVDIEDYLLQAARIEPTCGPDPFVTSAPIVCDTPRQIVIDGQAIESGALTIDVRSACQIVIRNSLIVSGENAITINGSAVVRVDNSIIVGPYALLGARGTVILSAANSIFHGQITTRGAFSFIDRGGNVFE